MSSEPLVPILKLEDGQIDPVTLGTWHEALSNTVAVEVSHDLMALWLYPVQGGVVLLGPGELAQDELVIPLPAPRLKPEQVTLVEEIVHDAGYRSVTCLPVRFGKRDVALLLVANLAPDRYGSVERVLLQCVAQRIAPMLGRIARQWKPAEGSSFQQREHIAGLLETVAQANADAVTPQRFIATLSRGLAAVLPHEHIELIISESAAGRYFRLGEHPGGPLWTDPSLVISRDHLDLEAIFGASSRLLVPDVYEENRWPRGFLTATEPAGADIRSIVGVRLGLREKAQAYLLVGSIGPELYTADDLELLVLLGGLITPQIGGFVAETPKGFAETPKKEERLLSAAVDRVSVPERDSRADLLFRIAGLLATTSDRSVATQLLAAEAMALLPMDKLIFVLRVTGGERVALMEPGERRPLSSLPLVSVGGTPLARVLQGSLPCAFEQHSEETRLTVPLRVAGRIHGALTFTALHPNVLGDQHVVPAQHLADIVAAHMELFRRVSQQPHPTVSRWREKASER